MPAPLHTFQSTYPNNLIQAGSTLHHSEYDTNNAVHYIDPNRTSSRSYTPTQHRYISPDTLSSLENNYQPPHEDSTANIHSNPSSALINADFHGGGNTITTIAHQIIDSSNQSDRYNSTTGDDVINNSNNGIGGQYSHAFKDLQVIGSGAEGVVYKARDPNNPDRFVALKKLTVPLYTEQGIPCNLLREIAYLKHLSAYSHPNLVKILDIAQGSRRSNELVLFLIFEHMDYDLANYLKAYPTALPPVLIKHLLKQLLQAIRFLHSHAIVHRDVKPQNILVSQQGLLKLTDFGLARDFVKGMCLTTVVVTLWYRPPEVLLHSFYATSVDIWSAGCIFAEMYLKKPLFDGNSEIDQLDKILRITGLPDMNEWPHQCPIPYKLMAAKYKHIPFNSLPSIFSRLSPEGLSLIQKMLLFNPCRRPTADAILKDSYFVR